MDNMISDKEHDQIVSLVFDEVERIYGFDYSGKYNVGDMALPWTTCTTCGEKHRCVCSIVDMSAECPQCRFKRRLKEEEDKLIEQKLARRRELLKDFAELS